MTANKTWSPRSKAILGGEEAGKVRALDGEPEETEDALVSADGYGILCHDMAGWREWLSDAVPHSMNRYSATEVFGGKSLSCVGYTYDDVILLPGHINFGVEEVQLTTRFTRKIALSVPFVSRSEPC